jgi:hypothetical protein
MNETTPTNGVAATVRPVDYVRGLPVEDQEEILMFLLKEAIRVNGGSTIILMQSETEDLGYYVPPAAVNAHFEAFGPKFTPEEEAMLDERFSRLHEARPAREVIEELRREADAMRRQRG